MPATITLLPSAREAERYSVSQTEDTDIYIFFRHDRITELEPDVRAQVLTDVLIPFDGKLHELSTDSINYVDNFVLSTAIRSMGCYDHGNDGGRNNITLDDLNLRYAVVSNGSSTVIADKRPMPDGTKEYHFLNQKDFTLKYSDVQVPVGNKFQSIGSVWLSSRNRRHYESVIFDPDNRDFRFLNLWEGFSIKPQKILST